MIMMKGLQQTPEHVLVGRLVHKTRQSLSLGQLEKIKDI